MNFYIVKGDIFKNNFVYISQSDYENNKEDDFLKKNIDYKVLNKVALINNEKHYQLEFISEKALNHFIKIRSNIVKKDWDYLNIIISNLNRNN